MHAGLPGRDDAWQAGNPQRRVNVSRIGGLPHDSYDVDPLLLPSSECVHIMSHAVRVPVADPVRQAIDCVCSTPSVT